VNIHQDKMVEKQIIYMIDLKHHFKQQIWEDKSEIKKNLLSNMNKNISQKEVKIN
jgi:hypothetical protein